MDSYWKGYYKILGDGSAIVKSAERSRVVQVDQDGEILWEMRLLKDRDKDIVAYVENIPGIRYYEKSYPQFLEGQTHE